MSDPTGSSRSNPLSGVEVALFDWGGTLMSEDGPADLPMGLWPKIEVLPGAAECLARLAGRRPLALATNASVSTRPLIERALARAGLSGSFEALFCYTELGLRKSQPAFWQAVSQHFGLPLERMAMVGDSYEQDAALPRSFGVQGVWLNPAGSPAGSHGPVPEVRDLRQFAEWVLDAA